MENKSKSGIVTDMAKVFYNSEEGMPAREMYYQAVLRQIDAMDTWVRFIRKARMIGANLTLNVQVDGVGSETGAISLGRSSGQDLCQWLYDWGCAKLMVLYEERDEIRRLWPGTGANLPPDSKIGE